MNKMDRFIMNDGGIQALATQIGCVFDGSFFMPEECTEVLEKLVALLNEDDKNTCQIRLQMHLAQILPQKLVPLLISIEDRDDVEDKTKLYGLTIRLMTNLTQPTECLLPSYLFGEAGYENLVTEMNKFLAVGRDAFLDGEAVTVILKQMENLLLKAQHKEIPISDCEILNNCLFLLRNLLFIHDLDYRTDDGPRPYSILLGSLFQHGLTDVLMMVLKSAQREYWCIATAQLVSLLYKDEVSAWESTSFAQTISQGMPVDHLTHPDSYPKFLPSCANHTCENSSHGSVSESPRFEKTSPTSSSKDSSGPGDWSQHGHSPQSLNNPHSLHSPHIPHSPQFGSSSQGSPQRVSPVTTRSCVGNDMRQKGVFKLENEISLQLTQLKIREQLSIFTKCFLEEGFVSLVTAMRSILLDSEQSLLPDLYFMWVVGYFLNWALKLRIPFKFFKPCLSVDIVGFLVYSGVNSCEQLLVAVQGGKDPSTAIRRNQLVVVALNRLFTAMDQLSEYDMDEEDREHLRHLHSAVVRMGEVKNFFVLVLRHYNPTAQSLDHLRDIILTNHKFLLIAEKVSSLNQENSDFDMLHHIQSFSTTTIMGQYCRLLENFSINSTEVNDCIFTMMYHVAGDINRPEVLLQLPILKIFTEISETCINLPRELYRAYDFSCMLSLSIEAILVPESLMRICAQVEILFRHVNYFRQECNDVMNYMLQYFMNIASNDPSRCAEMLFGNMNIEVVDMEVDENEGTDGTGQRGTDAIETWNNWSDAEKDILFSLYSEGSESPNLLQNAKDALAQDGFERTHNEIAVQLCLQNLWSQEQIEKLLSTNKINGKATHYGDSSQKGIGKSRRSIFARSDMDHSSSSSCSSGDGSDSGSSPQREVEQLRVEHLVGRMVLKGPEDVIQWLQTVLLEACYIKLGGRFLREGWVPEEPVILHYAIQNKSIPLVPYTDSEEGALGNQEFQQILKILGFQPPQLGVLMWPRVPNTWTPVELISKARLLGPVNMEMQKFAEDDLQKHIELRENTEMIMSDGVGSRIMDGGRSGKVHFPGMHMSDLWYVFVRQCTLYNKKQFDAQKMSALAPQSKT